MAHTVIVQPKALDDIDRTVGSLSRHVSLEAAEAWRARIESALLKIARDPSSYPEAEEAAALGIELRMHLVGRRRHIYRILFTVVGSAVNVLRIRHAARDWLDADEFS